MRRTHSLVLVAMAILSEPTARHWGYDLSKKSGVRSGVLYPMLTRMLEEGWLDDGWENPDTIVEKRPPRRYYELTSRGQQQLGGIVSSARQDQRFRSMFGHATADGLA